MHTVCSSKPASALRPYIRYYAQRRAFLPESLVIAPVPARIEQFVEFQFRQLFEVHAYGTTYTVPQSVIVGPHTYHQGRLVLSGIIETFTIVFQPAGFHQLFKLPMGGLVDQCIELERIGEVVWSELRQQLGEDAGFDERVATADQFLLPFAMHIDAADPVALAARRLLQRHGRVRVADLAVDVGLSTRHFVRRFTSMVGLPPKYYARIVRFQTALDLKTKQPGHTWTDIAHSLGYTDQMHLVHDFVRLSGVSPTRLQGEIERLTEAPLPVSNGVF
jgi:AraC-like DNA-binding protein